LADHALLLQALRRFAVVMGGSYDINEMSIQLGERLTEALGAAGAGVSVADEKGRLKFVTATSEQIVAIEEVQERLQRGPCVSAFESQEPVALGDIGGTARWPDYRDAALRLGLNAVVGYPLSYEGHRLGALNLYSADRRQWTDDDLDVIGVFADMSTAYLVRDAELAETRDLARQLQGALESRVMIEQAKGVLANEHGITVDEAFERLRRYSQDKNIKLYEVCVAVVEDDLRI
jgi:GAF domain-containing protein